MPFFFRVNQVRDFLVGLRQNAWSLEQKTLNAPPTPIQFQAYRWTMPFNFVWHFLFLVEHKRPTTEPHTPLCEVMFSLEM